jgi:hypothetical protein
MTVELAKIQALRKEYGTVRLQRLEATARGLCIEPATKATGVLKKIREPPIKGMCLKRPLKRPACRAHDWSP